MKSAAKFSQVLSLSLRVIVGFGLVCLVTYAVFFDFQPISTFKLPRALFPQMRLPIFYPYSDFSESIKQSGRAFWDTMKPGFNCPKSSLLRAGNPHDGGKWTCGLNHLAKYSDCLVYSFGVNGDSTFEAEVLETTHCEVYAYDPTVTQIGPPLKPNNNRVHFEMVGISGGNLTLKGKEYRTLKSLMGKNGDHEWIDILKIDVEGAEYVALDKLMSDYPPASLEEANDEGLPFGQLLIEVHAFGWKLDNVTKTSPEAERLVDFFRRLESRGLRMFNFEVNPAGGGTCCCELSFINTKRLERFIPEDNVYRK